MIKKLTIYSAALATLTLGTIFTSPIIANADVATEKNTNFSNDQTNISQNIVNKSNPYISFNKSTNKFTIDSTLKSIINSKDYKNVTNQVKMTNQQLEVAINDNETTIRVSDTDGSTINLYNPTTRKAGKNDVDFHWNYARIYLSKQTVNNISTGVTIAGIWIPAARVADVLATLGVIGSTVKNGIWFDYNYAVGVLVGNYGWQ